MKTSTTQLVATLGLSECEDVFRRAVDKRPLIIRWLPFRYFTPESDGSDLSVGAMFHAGENDGAVVMRCRKEGNSTRVVLHSTGNARGRMATNKLVKHVADMFGSSVQG